MLAPHRPRSGPALAWPGLAAGKLDITRRQPPACSPTIGAKVPSGPTRAL